jgi:hypothetical protein
VMRLDSASHMSRRVGATVEPAAVTTKPRMWKTSTTAAAMTEGS